MIFETIAEEINDRMQQKTCPPAIEIWLRLPRLDKSGVCVSLIYNGTIEANIPRHIPCMNLIKINIEGIGITIIMKVLKKAKRLVNKIPFLHRKYITFLKTFLEW